MFSIRIGCLVFILITSAIVTSGQKFGGNPPDLRWKQINSDTARIVFPAGLEVQAKDVARIVHQLANLTVSTIGGKLRKVNIVLQNQTTLSNGYVSLGPFRSEFFLTPRQNSFELGSLPWHKTLALHEYRHVQQYNNFRKGLSRVFYYIFGEEGQSVANNTAVPEWFWEGDAVYQETLLSQQGRGRIPFFFNDFQSLNASGKRYSWMKLRNGSYRDFVPDHYRLGYMMVDYGRQKYGENIWKYITADAVSFKGLFYPFQKAVKKYTGETYPSFRKNALEHFLKPIPEIRKKDAAATYGSKHKHFVADEEYPQWMNTNTVVYVKSSYRKIASFYIRKMDTGKESRLCSKDISADTYFSYKNGRIVYAAYHTDIRWTWKDFGSIKLVDINSGTQKKVTHRTHYFSPDINDQGTKIVAVDIDPSGKNTLHILDAITGKIITEIPNRENYIFTYPKFYGQNEIVAAIRNGGGQMNLVIVNISTGTQRLLTDFSMRIKGFIQVNKDTISFTMSDGSTEKLFVWIKDHLWEWKPGQANLSTGNYHLSLQGSTGVWTSFTSAGYHLFSGQGSLEKTKPLVDPPILKMTNLISDSVQVQYPVSAYPALSRLINVHSWRPTISDPEYSYALLSQNILNTLQSELFVTYNRNEKYKEAGASLAYAGRYPVVRLAGTYTYGRTSFTLADPVTWNEVNGSFGAAVPLNAVNGTFYQQVTPSIFVNAKQLFYTGASKLLYRNTQFNFGEYSLSASNRQQKVKQQIYPRFAQTIYVRYRAVINKFTANQLLLNSAIYFPGFAPNHSIVIQGAYQRRDTLRRYNFSNTFSFSRGYIDVDFPKMVKLGVNYHFPIVYPDAGFGSMVYLLRMRGNVFYDFTETKSLRTRQISTFRTLGAELYFDSKWWNQLPLSFGIRYSRLLDKESQTRSPNQWELVLPVNILAR